MKHLLAFLLIESLLSPAWSQEVGITPEEFAELEAFIEKVGNMKPWTLEKVEAELGVKFEQTSLTEIYRGYTAYGKPLSIKNLPIQYISLDMLEANNEMHSLIAYIDSDSSCLTRKEIQTLYPKGFLDASHAFPAGGLLYFVGQPWGVAVFDFGANNMKKECLLDISVKSDHHVSEYYKNTLKKLRSQK